MKLLLISDVPSDFAAVLRSCDAEIVEKTEAEAFRDGLDGFDTYCVLSGTHPIARHFRLRDMLEQKADEGHRIFLERPASFGSVYSQPAVNTVRSRLVYVGDEKIPGLMTGDILDEESNEAMEPWFALPCVKPLLVYREHIIAHAHTDLPREAILKDSRHGIWMMKENIIMTSFLLKNFNRARFSPRSAWQSLLSWLCEWLTGSRPGAFPAPVVTFGPGKDRDLTDPETFEQCRRQAVRDGIRWLESFLADGGENGIREGLAHNIDPDGHQAVLETVRTDCTGESAGAFRAYAWTTGDRRYAEIADRLESVVFGPMQIKKGLFAGMLRWSADAWEVCYQDDAARALLPTLYRAWFRGEKEHLPEVFRALDFLLKITCRDGCPEFRTDCRNVPDEAALNRIAQKEKGLPSAHYNAYYFSALLLGYLCGGGNNYLETARKGLETIMALYPDTRREQSETEELCRLIPALSLLLICTGEERYRAMLDRVTGDLQRFRHPFGGYMEWDTGYTAACSRESAGECSVLTENGDPVADSLYSSNWLPIGFSLAWRATGDEKYRRYWREIVSFYIRIQAHGRDQPTDGAWCRAFDMDREEAFANPHDVGWAAFSCETGWTQAEILMGMMEPFALSSAGV